MKTSIVLLPHQDDEIGILGELESAKIKHRIIFLFLTSGDVKKNFSVIRNKESLSVLNFFGYKSEDIYFLSKYTKVRDTNLIFNINITLSEIFNVVKLNNVENIYYPAWEGGHEDHDACHILAIGIQKATKKKINFFQFPLYNGFSPNLFRFKLFNPIPSSRFWRKTNISLYNRFKLLYVIFFYKSQFKTWVGLYPFFVLNILFFSKQYTKKISNFGSISKPHSTDILFYERRKRFLYVDFVDQILKLKWKLELNG
jgi:LmbE family N-acetylglucosaminyl deacetylase